MKTAAAAVGSRSGFTLAEMLVSMAVLAILILLIAQLFNSTMRATSVSTTHLEADDRARVLFGRMAADFSRIVTRTDVDAYLKSAATPQAGNDQFAFYSEVDGYSSSSDAQNTVALVAYRVNPGGARAVPSVERMGKALGWSGSAGIQSVAFLPLTISATWPAATNGLADADYEEISADTFRMETYYLLRSGTLSAVPWDTVAGGTSVNGFQDVAAIGVAIAMADRRAVTAAGGTAAPFVSLASKLGDFQAGMKVGQLEQQWQAAVTASGAVPAIQSGIHIYGRLFPVGPVLRP